MLILNNGNEVIVNLIAYLEYYHITKYHASIKILGMLLLSLNFIQTPNLMVAMLIIRHENYSNIFSY